MSRIQFIFGNPIPLPSEYGSLPKSFDYSGSEKGSRSISRLRTHHWLGTFSGDKGSKKGKKKKPEPTNLEKLRAFQRSYELSLPKGEVKCSRIACKERWQAPGGQPPYPVFCTYQCERKSPRIIRRFLSTHPEYTWTSRGKSKKGDFVKLSSKEKAQERIPILKRGLQTNKKKPKESSFDSEEVVKKKILSFLKSGGKRALSFGSKEERAASRKILKGLGISKDDLDDPEYLKEVYKGLMPKKRGKKMAKKRKVAKKKAAKKVSKKKASKKASKKPAKKVRRKAKKSAKKAVAKKVAKKATKKIRRKAKKNPVFKSRKYRRNPVMSKELKFGVMHLGHTAEEALTLAAGGAFYGSANRILAKIPGVTALMSVPVVGSSILPMLAGALLHGMTKGKSGRVAKLAASLGKGLVAASVVSIGVNAGDKVVRATLGRFIPGLAGHEMGYDEYSSGSDPADFGELVNTGIPEGLRGSADFGYPVDAGIPEGLRGVDFTESMGGVDFTMGGDHEMGEYEMGGVDFTSV